MQQVWSWLTENASLISAFASLLMAATWLFYANLAFHEYRTRRHPRLMIHQAPDAGSDAECHVVNLSTQLLDIVGVFAADAATGRQVQITDYRRYDPDRDSGQEMGELLKQGPLGSGQSLRIGTFKVLLSRLEQGAGASEEGDSVDQFEVRVALYHGSSRLPAGACRSFTVKRQDGRVEVRPNNFETTQMRSRRHGRKVLRWLDRRYAKAAS
jgi:hypothetical protein